MSISCRSAHREASTSGSIFSPIAASFLCAILKEDGSLPSPAAKATTLRCAARPRSLRCSPPQFGRARANGNATCPFPSLLFNRDDRSELTIGAREALFDTADRLALPEAMADADCDGFAHKSCNLVTWTCMRAILIERRSCQEHCAIKNGCDPEERRRAAQRAGRETTANT